MSVRGGLGFKAFLETIKELNPELSEEQIYNLYKSKKTEYVGETLSSGMSEEEKKKSQEVTIAIAEKSWNAISEIANQEEGWLPGSSCRFVVRKEESGEIVVTAENCHAKGNVPPIHIFPNGEVKIGGKPYRNRRKHAAVGK